MTANHFESIREFRNTVRMIQCYWNVPRAVAQDMQRAIARGAAQSDINAAAAASLALRTQIGA